MEKKAKRNITILIIIISMIIIMAYIYHSKGSAALIAQHGNMVVMKMQIQTYEETYGTNPTNVEVLQLPLSFTDNLNVKYPDDDFLFYEKKSRKYGFKNGKFFVHKDGFVEFVPKGKEPQKR